MPLGEKSAVPMDLSTNGTWVNKVKVGKKRQMILSHCSVVCILEIGGECFRYIDRGTIYLHNLRHYSKYIDGDILRKGTISEVRSG